MPGPDSRERLQRILAKVGVGVAALAVFTAGWVAMNTTDWRVIASVTALALAAGWIASRLSIRSR